MARTKIGSNAIFSGTGLGITYIADRLYGYSGNVTADNTERDLLNFNTGKGYTVATVRFMLASTTSADFRFIVYFNGSLILSDVSGGSAGESHALGNYHIIIPPLTHVRMTADNVSSSDSVGTDCMITGRVYDA